LGSDSGKGGSMALANVQKEAKNPKVRKDSINISQSIQTLVNWIVKFNQLGSVKFIYKKEKETNLEFLEKQKKLFEIGYRAKQDYLEDRLGYELELVSEYNPKEIISTNSATPTDPLSDYVDNVDLDEHDNEVKGFIDSIFKNSKDDDKIDVDEVMETLLNEFPNFEPKALTNILENGLMNSRLSGEVNYNKA
jgi:hypothetical protein